MKILGERPASPAYPMTEQDAFGNRTGNHEAPMTLDTRRMRTEWSEYERTTKDWVTIAFPGQDHQTPRRSLIRGGYSTRVTPTPRFVGSYNCRDIRGGTGRSRTMPESALAERPDSRSS